MSDPDAWIEIDRVVRPGMPVYEGDPPVRLRSVATVAQDGVRVSELTMCVHAGTHVDAPRHVDEGGAGADSLRLEDLCGPAWLLDARDIHDSVPAAVIDRVPPDAERLLVATRAAEFWDQAAFRPDLVGLSPGAAAAVAERGMRLVGIDYMSIAPTDDPLPVHRTLLAAGVAILEGLDMRGLEEGRYELLAAPIRLGGADGAPTRAAVRRAPS